MIHQLQSTAHIATTKFPLFQQASPIIIRINGNLNLRRNLHKAFSTNVQHSPTSNKVQSHALSAFIIILFLCQKITKKLKMPSSMESMRAKSMVLNHSWRFHLSPQISFNLYRTFLLRDKLYFQVPKYQETT